MMKKEKIIHKSFKTRNFRVFLTEYDNKFTVEYNDKRCIESQYTIIQVTEYEYEIKAEWNFNRLVESCILLDIENVKKYMLYMQNEYKYEKRKRIL